MADVSVSDSILLSTKKMLSIAPTDISFDVDVILHINSVFSTLTQLGIGPEDGFMIIDDSAKWTDFLILDGGFSKLINSVRTYVYLRVRLIFDPPANSFAIDSFQKQIQELEWRLNVVREQTDWVNPNPSGAPYNLVIDGGSATTD